MKKQHVFFVFLISSIAFFLNGFSALAQAPLTTFTTSVENIKTTGTTVTGDIHITNSTNKTGFGVFVTTMLRTPDKTGSKTENGKLIAYSQTGLTVASTVSDTFSLSPAQEVTKSFSLSFPSTITSGTYFLLTTIQDVNGKVLGIENTPVDIKGSNQFLTVDTTSCRITVDGVSFLPSDGPIIPEGSEAVGTCIFTNSTEKAVTAHWKMSYQADPSITNTMGDKKTVTDTKTTYMAPGATQTLSFSFPSVSVPQVYEGSVVILNGKNEQISPEIEFRWTVPGPSARIRTIEADKNVYTKGETAKVTIVADPSMDLFWMGNPYLVSLGSSASANVGTKLKNPSLAVAIVDGKGQLCGEVAQKVTASSDRASWPVQNVSVAIKKDCMNPTVQASVSDAGSILAKQKQQYATSDGTPTQSGSNTKYWVIALLIIFVAAAIAIVWYVRKRKNVSSMLDKTIVTVLFFLFGVFTLIHVPLVRADNDNTGGGNGNTNQPTAVPVTATVTPAGTGATNTPTPSGPPTATPTPYGYTTDYTAGMGVVPHAGENVAPGGLYMVRDWEYPTDHSMVTHLGQFLFYPDGQMGTSIVPNADGSYTINLGTSVSQNGCGNMMACIQAMPEIDGSSEGMTINGVATNQIELYQQAGATSLTAHANTFVINRPTATSCNAHTVKVKLALCGGYAPTGSLDSNTWWWHDNTLNSNLAAYAGFKAGTNCVTTLSNTGTPMQTCFGSFQKAVPATACTITPTPGSITPTPVRTCNKSCASDVECERSGDGCTECKPNAGGTGKTCQPGPTPTPTPILSCNKSCTNSSECALGVDGCTVCLPNDTGTGSVCKTPPACGVSCTKDAQCAGARDGCNVCNAGKCSKFSPDMCKCDGMDFTTANGATTFFPGDNVSFIAFGKVEGANVNVATLQSMTFSMYQSSLTNPNQSTRIAQSTAITPEVVQNDPTKVRYKVTWNQKIPSTVPSGSLFRVQAEIPSNGGCVPKANPNPAVQGASTTSFASSYYAGILRTLQGIMTNTKTVLGTHTLDQQQADTFFPGARISEKSCKIIKFFFE